MRKTILITAMLAGAVVAQAALVSHYTLDETSGTSIADSSGNGNTGTVAAGGDLSVPGVSNTGIDGRTSGPSLYSGNAARTIALWFNADTVAAQGRLTGTGTGAASQFDVVFESSTGGNSVGLRYGNGNMFWSGTAENGSAIATDAWNHVAVTYDGNFTADVGLKFYLNGTLLAMDGGNGNNQGQTLTTASSDFLIGTSAAGNLFDGQIDDVQVYNTALGQSDVTALFNNPGVAIPEPATLGMVALFGGGILFIRRKFAM